MSRTGRRHWIYCLAFIGLFASTGALPMEASDDPVVTISPSDLAPHRLEVHLGERVRWRASGGQRLRLELDPHHGAHEVVIKQGEIQAVFLRAGEHWYQGSLMNDGEKAFRGVVVVREAGHPLDVPRMCGPESSDRICFMP